jgi:hypothetical protein
MFNRKGPLIAAPFLLFYFVSLGLTYEPWSPGDLASDNLVRDDALGCVA